MIFPIVEVESVLQVNDKTRLLGTKTFTTPDEAAITLVEIEPDTGLGFIDVTALKYLDWAYDSAGDKTVSLRVTTDAAPVTQTATISVVTAEEDKLFSSDQDILALEKDLINYIPVGRSSWLDKHRAAQTQILEYLNNTLNRDNRLTKANIITIDEVRDWSKYLTLRLIFEDISNAVDDVFHQKASHYAALMDAAKNKSFIRLDLDGDGEEDRNTYTLRTSRLSRR